MKEGWKIKTLGELCEINIGRTPSRSDTSLWDKEKKSHNVWVSIADMPDCPTDTIYETKEYISDKAARNINIIKKGTILLSFKLTLGKTAIAGIDLYTNEAIANLPIKDKEISREYLLYYFRFFDWNSYSSGEEKVKGKTLNKKKLDVLPIYYPSLSEQQAIVSRLDSAFAKIDAVKANAEKQLNDAKVLFQKGLSKAMIPKEGWEEKKLPDISENLDSLRRPVTKKNRVVGKYPYYGASGIVDYVDDYLFDEKLLCISEDGANLLMRTYPIAFSISGKVWVNNHAHVLRFTDEITQRYVEFFFKILDIEEYITGAAQPKLTQKALNNITINIPPDIVTQQAIVTHLDTLSEKLKTVEEKQKAVMAECDAMKQALLREVFE